MAKAQARREALGILDKHGIPEALSMGELRERLEDIRGRKIEYRIVAGLAGQEIHGVWGGDFKQSIDTVYLPPLDSIAAQFFICCHEHGHMLATPSGHERTIGTVSHVRDLVAGSIPLGRALDFTYMHSDFSHEDERLAETVGAELAVRVLRFERARGRDFQFGRVFGG